jgi:hypothetical protein
VIVQAKVARPRGEAVRAGWNDAAWRRPQRQVEADLAQFYESGYSGGMEFATSTSRTWWSAGSCRNPCRVTHQRPERLNHHQRQATVGVGWDPYGDQLLLAPRKHLSTSRPSWSQCLPGLRVRTCGARLQLGSSVLFRSVLEIATGRADERDDGNCLDLA